jgi:ABC-type glycerol-3-phosphate transport system substrate-binding protein
MKSARSLRFGAVFVAAAMLVASCGSNASEGTDSGGKVELLVWASREQYIPPDKFQAFMKENPNITVKFDVQDGDDILQQLQRMRAANQPLPDIIQDDSFVLSAYKEADLIQPIGDVIKRWQEEDPKSYAEELPIVFDEGKIDGVQYGIAPTSDFDAFYYSIPAFQKANVQLPFKSWDDVLAGLKAVKAADPDIIPLSMQAKAGEGVTAMKGLMSNVGVPFNGATPDLTSPAGIYVIDWYKQAHQANLLPPDAITWGQDESRGAFLAKKAAMLIDGLNSAADFLEAPDLKYDRDWNLSPKPTSSDGSTLNGANVSSARSWAITAGSQHPYEASLILRYVSSAQNLLNTISQRVIMPRNTAALNSPELAKYLPFLAGELKASFEGAKPAPAAPNAAEVEGVLEQLLGEIVQGTDQSAQQLADKYQKQLDALKE